MQKLNVQKVALGRKFKHCAPAVFGKVIFLSK